MQQTLEQKEQEQSPDWIRRTSQNILAIGEGLVAFLKVTDRIVLSPVPYHEPDKEFINELVQLLSSLPPQQTLEQYSGDD